MSSYVVEDVTINKVVAYLYFEAMGSNSDRQVMQKLDRLGYNLLSHEDCQRLAENMFWLNARAVDQRYSEGEAEKFRPLDFSYKLLTPVSPIATLKALECWHYQCCEGDVPLHSLFVVMDEIADIISRKIVHELPEWIRGEWV